MVLDEDEYARLELYNKYSGKNSCPYFSPFGDEYDIVKKQN
ncbi:MAG: DUF6472 family protein [Clostridiales bacterium]|nr:DUF6472 family protein [Clostridiales bacterium]